VDWLRVTQVVSVGLGEAWEKMRAVPVDWSQLVINGIVVLWALRGEYFHFLLISLSWLLACFYFFRGGIV
jgi:hypothetical protein